MFHRELLQHLCLAEGQAGGSRCITARQDLLIKLPVQNLPAQLGISSADLNMMMKAKKIFDKMNSASDKNTDLIMALKPHLSPENRNKADTAIKILRLFDALPYLKELF